MDLETRNGSESSIARDPSGVKAHWGRRIIAFAAEVVLPWSLLTQASSTVLTGRSWPDGALLSSIGILAFVLVCLISASLTRNGQSLVHRWLRLRVYDATGGPATRQRMLLRNLAQIVNIATLGAGFVWAFCNAKRRTFADSLVKTHIAAV